MELTAQVDNYCERTDFTFWSEPINAVTNASFLIAALVVWAMLGGKKDPMARLLVTVLAAIGVGSFLFHTFATSWAGAADVFPILLFILIYVYAATTRFFTQSIWVGALAVGLFFPYAYLVSSAIGSAFGPLNGSVAYAPVPILIFGYGLLMLRRDPATARGLFIGAGLLVASLVFRTIDESVCQALPIGTHFLWHVFNGIMLGWMIIVLHRCQIR